MGKRKISPNCMTHSNEKKGFLWKSSVFRTQMKLNTMSELVDAIILIFLLKGLCGLEEELQDIFFYIILAKTT